MRSLRAKIILFVFLAMALKDIFVGIYIYLDTEEEVEELFNAEQAQLARVIDSILERGLLPGNEESLITDVPAFEGDTPSAIGHHYEQKLAFQVWDSHGNLWMMSKNAPLYPLSAQSPGFSKINYDDANWFVFALYSTSTNSWIYTAQLEEVRNELIGLIVADQLVPSVLASFVVLVLIVVAVYFGTRDIAKFSAEVESRGSNHLSPIDITLPEELEPIRKSVNGLMQQIQQAISREKSFNADAAHELRTPLAALRVQLQNMSFSEPENSTRNEHLRKMMLSIDKMAHTVEQLLFLNRLDAYKIYNLDESVSLLAVAREVISDLSPEVLERYKFSVDGEDIVVKGNANLLANLVRNLVENAYKYSPQDSAIEVLVRSEGSKALFEVVDSGPGLTDEQKQKVTDRFYRISDRQNYGTGLGLSIVKRIIDLHSASLQLVDASASGGLICRVSFNRFL